MQALQQTRGVLDDSATRAGNLDEFVIGHVEQTQQAWIGGIVHVNRIGIMHLTERVEGAGQAGADAITDDMVETMTPVVAAWLASTTMRL
jgi:hypothetical protein